MNKNNIILIGIVLLFLLVIRPKSNKEDATEETTTFEGSSGVEHGGSGGTFGEVEAVPMTYTNYKNNSYVQTSLDNASHTNDESLNLQGQTYTV